MPEPHGGPASLWRALQKQFGNYDETTTLIFITPDGGEYVWDPDPPIDWRDGDMVMYLSEPYEGEDEDEGLEDEDAE